MSGKVFELKGAQREAVDPRDTVWLSASAGTGKTQVLSARVLRLLMRKDVEPTQLLCLTFTKAGAAEMAVRVNSVLARWVRLPETELAHELLNIGADNTQEAIARARSLFASVLDCPGGGLRIDTIHAFAQWLLSAFPEEAGILPGTRAMEDRDRELLARDVLADLLESAEERDDRALIEPIENLSLRLGPDGARSWLMDCARHASAFAGPGGWQGPLKERVLALLGLPSDATRADLAALCEEPAFDLNALRQCRVVLDAWGSKTGQAGVEAIDGWLRLDPSSRAEGLQLFAGALFTKSDPARPTQLANILKRDPAYEEAILAVRESRDRVLDYARALDLADWFAPALEAGRAFAFAWEEAKRREGLVDYDDLISNAARLLTGEPGADWIRYKLDRRIDHILVDEAQDTNTAQWQIIRALADDFFSGEGQKAGRQRTLFVVGDYKQAIFGFQGTSPRNFGAARMFFADKMDAAARNFSEIREQGELRPLRGLGLERSFRTARPILEFVDRAIDAIGPEGIGLEGHEPHAGEDRPGIVTMWAPVKALGDIEADEPGDTGLSDTDYALAERIAGQVTDWIGTFPLQKHDRYAEAGDIMILVRKRKELAGLIVSRLYAAGIPVAGVDRLRLGDPFAIKDLMAAIRFAVQPHDNLNLANLLVSPLMGWSQEDLLEHGYRQPDQRNASLWDHLRSSTASLPVATADRLRDLLRRADFGPPQELLHWILVGPWQGRKRLVSRLGPQANDPIDELVNAAIAYASSHTASLQGFVHWFDAGDGELKRESGEAHNEVRVMTVHGAKGLQAPIVVLADATGDPSASRTSSLSLQAPMPEGVDPEVVMRPEIPVPSMPSAEKPARLREHEDARRSEEMEEHWRLLYVAMTRAEEALFIGGALTPAQSKRPVPEDSWYARLEPLFGEDPLEDSRWGARRELGGTGEISSDSKAHKVSEQSTGSEIPAWLHAPVGEEPRPPKPLVASRAGEDLSPLAPSGDRADPWLATRGTLIHKLLERLPDIAPADRLDRAQQWLANQAPQTTEQQREELIAAATAVLEDARFARLFSSNSLAEVPLAAVVDGQVVTGIVDRLLVTPDEILVVDYKTTRRPPAAASAIAQQTVSQMAAYAAALNVIYPGRKVRAAVLYTHAPALFEIEESSLEERKGALLAK